MSHGFTNKYKCKGHFNKPDYNSHGLSCSSCLEYGPYCYQ